MLQEYIAVKAMAIKSNFLMCFINEKNSYLKLNSVENSINKSVKIVIN